MLQWHVDAATMAGEKQATSVEITARLVILNFASLHPTVELLVQAFDKLFTERASRYEISYIDNLRAEGDALPKDSKDWGIPDLWKLAELDR
jgi:hypothetical protein